MEDLVTNPWLNLIMGLSGIAIAIIFYLRGRKIKKPIYDIKSSNVVRDIGGKFDHLELIYKKQPIANFTISMVSFWNAGNETIDWNDVTELEPITISTKDDYHILDAKILNTVNSTNNFRIEFDDSTVSIKFDYVGKGQGAIFQIIHTGKDNNDLKFKGTLKNTLVLEFANKGWENFGQGNFISRTLPDTRYKIFIILAILTYPTMISVPFVTNHVPDSLKSLMPYSNYLKIYFILYITILAIMYLQLAIIFGEYLHFIFSTRMPKELRLYWDNLAADQPEKT